MNSTWSPDEPSGVSGLHLSDTGKTLIFYLIGWTPPGLHLDSTWTHKFNILFNSYLLIIITKKNSIHKIRTQAYWNKYQRYNQLGHDGIYCQGY